MKTMRLTTLAATLLAATLLFNGCMGSFGLTNKLYSWNHTVGSKFVNELVFAAFVIVPVYGVTLFIDGIILNSIEFWGGSNPVSMEDGEQEMQYVKSGDREYLITATKNRFVVEQLSGPGAGETAGIIFDPEEQSCYLDYNGEINKIAEYLPGPGGQDKLNLFLPDGSMVCMDAGERDMMHIRALLSSATHQLASAD